MLLIFKRVSNFLIQKQSSLFWLLLLLILLITVQQYLGGTKSFGDLPYSYTHYNNYLIFKFSSIHFIHHQDLYSLYLTDHWDLYKYSPTFAMLFGIFAWMPDWAGLFLWNAINGFCLFFGIRMLPSFDLRQKNIVFLILLVELITSLQNSQSNALIAGLVLMAFALMERENFFWACLLIALTVYIKLFGLFAFAICLLFPGRWKMVGYSIFWMAALFVLPLLIIDFAQLKTFYESWLHLLQQDYVPNSLSLVGGFKNWFGWVIDSNVMLLMGVLFFGISLLRWKQFGALSYRFLFMSQVLIWMVIFNHKAESPTFIIALTGVAIAYYYLPDRKWNTALLWLVIVFTSLSTTDVFPNFIQQNIFIPYSIKLLPCVIFYFFVLYNLLFVNYESMRVSGSGRSDQ
jgi:hypothetical protein